MTILGFGKKTPLFLMAAMLTLGTIPLAFSGNPATTPEVIMYLHDGTDVTGHLTGVNATEITLQTDKGKVQVPRKKYQGMVLNTPEQKKMAGLITTDPVVMMAYGMYSQKTRNAINAALSKSMANDPCALKVLQADQPVAHLEIDQQGHVKRVMLLNASQCQQTDKALLQNIKGVKMAPFPKDYPFKLHTLNYFYPQTAKTN